ncbi:MAG TPA: hypothetical protein VL200_03785 [Lacunisphaera sp.]|jgi:Spy/CpxP family protein refolding chaperone|nr:hypothetical protein [Lacunisphaera sp.]
MKTPLKFLLLLAGLAVLAAPILRADDNPPPPPSDQPEHGPGGHGGHRDPAAMMDRLARRLGLTDEQQAKWKDIGQQEKAALDALRDDKTVSKADRWAKFRDLRQQYMDQRRAVLTADQQKQFDEMQAKMRERMEHRHGDGGRWKPKDDQSQDAPPKDSQ